MNINYNNELLVRKYIHRRVNELRRYIKSYSDIPHDEISNVNITGNFEEMNVTLLELQDLWTLIDMAYYNKYGIRPDKNLKGQKTTDKRDRVSKTDFIIEMF